MPTSRAGRDLPARVSRRQIVDRGLRRHSVALHLDGIELHRTARVGRARQRDGGRAGEGERNARPAQQALQGFARRHRSGNARRPKVREIARAIGERDAGLLGEAVQRRGQRLRRDREAANGVGLRHLRQRRGLPLDRRLSPDLEDDRYTRHTCRTDDDLPNAPTQASPPARTNFPHTHSFTQLRPAASAGGCRFCH